MTVKHFLAALVCTLLALPASSQENDDEIDCNIEANKELPECLVLPDNGQDVTNVVPLAAPLAGLGLLGLAGAGGGGGGTVSTTSTTSTTGTN